MRRGNIMNIRKAVLVSAAFSLLSASSALAEKQESTEANNAVGEITVQGYDGEHILVKFEACEEKNNQSARGFLRLQAGDNDKDTYAEVAYVKVDGAYCWFAGKCTRDSDDLTGRWFFAAVHDGGTPGRLVDHIWLDWLANKADAESIAREKVKNCEKPQHNTPIAAGDIVVHYRGQEK